MTSDEIKAEYLGTNDPLWEIAYQLAVMNERGTNTPICIAGPALRGTAPDLAPEVKRTLSDQPDHAGHKWVDGLNTMEAIGKLCWPKSPRGGQGNS